MRLIKNAIVFKAELPRQEVLAEHLAELPFEPVGETFVSRSGFIPNGATGELLTPIEGGCSFTLRYDEKILPASAVRQAVSAAIEEATTAQGQELDGDEIGAIKERVTTELIAKALIKTTIVHAFYHAESNFLVVPTTNKHLAQVVIGSLIKVVGSVKTSTIHVDNIKGGLTTRLRNYLDGDGEAFGEFTMGDSVQLKDKKDRVSIDLGSLDNAKRTLGEALENKLMVERMALTHHDVAFKLTHNFQIKGIEFCGELTEDEEAQREDADAAFLWRLEAATQLLQLVATIQALCDLFGYKEPEQPEAAPALDDPDAVEGDELYGEVCDWMRSDGRPSVSAIQRKFKLGYNRAARLIERLELDGIVTPMSSNGSREIIK